jgi:hypothetical protein
MGKTSNDGEARASALVFLDELLAACGPTVGELAVPLDALASLTIDDTAGDPDAVLRRPGVRSRFVLLAERHRPAAERERIEGIDPLDVRAWPLEPAARARCLAAFRREVVELRHRIASPAPDLASLRIEPKQAIERGAPEHGLPPTPKNTFYRWVRNPANRDLLGIDRRLGKWAGQPVLVVGLLQLHASGLRRKKLPPGAAAKGAEAARTAAKRKRR